MKTRKMLAVLSALILGASYCISAVPAMAEEDKDVEEKYALYKGVLKEFVDVYGIPEKEDDTDDAFGNNKNTFCRLIDLNNDGLKELYVAKTDVHSDDQKGTIKVYAIVDDEVKCLYENFDFYTANPDTAEAVFHQTEENQYYLYEYRRVEDENQLAGDIYKWYTFDGNECTVKETYAIPVDEGFNTENYTAISSVEEMFTDIETETYEDENKNEIEVYRNYGIGSDAFYTRESVEVSRETYDYIMGLPDPIDPYTLTAVQLAKLSTYDISDRLFDKEYTVKHADFENRWFFYNDEAYDGRYEDLIFAVTADYDEHDDDGFPTDESVIKEKIESNDCYYSCVRSYWDEMLLDFPITDEITTSFDYLQVSEALDKEFDCRMIPVWSTGNGNLMGYEFEKDDCTVRLYFDLKTEKEQLDENGNVIEKTAPVDENGDEITDPRLLPADVPDYYTAEELKELNPSLIGFEVIYLLNNSTNYKELLDDYYDSITDKWKDYDGDDLYGIIYENTLDSSYMWRLDENINKMHEEIGYQFVDLNGDGVDELILTPVNTNEIYDLYTLYDGEYVHLCSGGEENKFYLGKDYKIYEETPFDDTQVSVQAYSLVDGALAEIETPEEWEYQVLSLRAFDNTDEEKEAVKQAAQTSTEGFENGVGSGNGATSTTGGTNNTSGEGQSPITKDKLPIAAGITAIAALAANILSRKKKAQ